MLRSRTGFEKSRDRDIPSMILGEADYCLWWILVYFLICNVLKDSNGEV